MKPSFLENTYPYLICYGVVAGIGIVIALVELISRYGTGNKASWILKGYPQCLYYSINAIAAMITLFVSETTGVTSIISKFDGGIGLAIIQSCKVGIVSMFALRSSLYSVEKGDKKQKMDFGPAQILNILNRYLDRQVDQNRGNEALKDVASIMKGYNPNLIDFAAICLRVPEAIPPEDLVRIRRNIDTLQRNSRELSPAALSIMVGLELQKEVGANTLRAVVDVLKANGTAEGLASSGVTLPPKDGEGSKDARLSAVDAPVQSLAMLSLDEELSAKYDEFSSGNVPAAGKDEGENK